MEDTHTKKQMNVFKCPACAFENKISVYSVINFEESPEVLEEFYDRTFNIIVCVKCRKKYLYNKPITVFFTSESKPVLVLSSELEEFRCYLDDAELFKRFFRSSHAQFWIRELARPLSVKLAKVENKKVKECLLCNKKTELGYDVSIEDAHYFLCDYCLPNMEIDTDGWGEISEKLDKMDLAKKSPPKNKDICANCGEKAINGYDIKIKELNYRLCRQCLPEPKSKPQTRFSKQFSRVFQKLRKAHLIKHPNPIRRCDICKTETTTYSFAVFCYQGYENKSLKKLSDEIYESYGYALEDNILKQIKRADLVEITVCLKCQNKAKNVINKMPNHDELNYLLQPKDNKVSDEHSSKESFKRKSFFSKLFG